MNNTSIFSLTSAYKALRSQGVLGINARNANYVLKYNPRSKYPLVDNKLKTKNLAEQHNVAVPELYRQLNSEYDIKTMESLLKKLPGFVIKPAQGAGGDGILVIRSLVQDNYRKSNGKLIGFDEISHHCSNILSGLFSLGGHPDVAMIEHRVISTDLFLDISYQGVPDIRVIVFKGYPIMAMLRLPTEHSNGKANLHQGAIGAAINISTGLTENGVWSNKPINEHPDTGNIISGISIPDWKKILKMSASCYDFTGLGYLGVDIIIDKYDGPMMLELNARPGLNIQIANQCGLSKRLKLIEREDKDRSSEQRVDFVIECFAD